MNQNSPGDLSCFFYPDSIAVIGVSPEENNLAKNIILNCLTLGYKGEILPVGLKGGVAFGQRIYPSVEVIDGKIDLAVILTPARTIPGILEQCGRKGIRNVVIESGGFSELGEEGKAMERACIEKAQRYGIRFIGPNCIGVTNMENGLALSFMALQKGLFPGPVSVLAQSGGVGLTYIGFLADEHIGLNKFVSMGNKLNVNETDLLAYLIRDEGTRIILVYLEGFSDGRRFIETARMSSKPILVYKANRFKESASIAHSHTAALFADDQLVDHALAQAGCIRINTLQDAMDYIKSRTLPPLRGNRLAIVSRSGGHAVIAADACTYYGFEFARLPKGLLKKFETRFRAHVIRLQNPLDLGDLFDLDFYVYILEELLKRRNVDGILLGHAYFRGKEQEPSRMLLKRVEQLVDQYQKPVVPVILTETREREYLRRNLSLPIFWAPENAMRALQFSYRWSKHTLPAPPATYRLKGRGGSRAEEIVRSAGERGHLLLSEGMDLLQAFGFPISPYRLVQNRTQALAAWKSLGAPVAMKINRPHVNHKARGNALRLNLDSRRQITEAFRELQTGTGKDVEVLVQPMRQEGLEVILGGKRDPVFGSIILFGLGGRFVELLGDVVWRVVPVSPEEASQMVRAIRGYNLLREAGGASPATFKSLERLLLKLSGIMESLSKVREIDINPVLVHRGETEVLDVRVIVD
ncbi:MAG: acetate--CoA ligase family protein [Deltaproteobacteria bacterium]|nr:acetate--CoA ligase family protein [Deltaproteobacteria bacterium]MBW2302137.1 acetate--CoA ligase family protein [Deltaproteobacteria bacterium]